MRKRLLLAAVLFATLLTSAATHSRLHAQEPVFFSNVNVFDGEQKIESTNVLIENGLITAVGKDVTATGEAIVIDGTGKTLMPGMIDCHTHVWFDSQLEQAAVFGVTTELDMMSGAENAARLRREQAEGEANDRADFFSAGAAVTVKGGHGTQFGLPVPTLEDGAGAPQFVHERVLEGSDYIKIIYEDGSAYGMQMPTIDEAMLAASVIAAHEAEKLAVAHVSTGVSAKMAIDNGIDGLVHLFANSEITPEMIELAKSKNIFVVPTASVVSNASGSNLTAMIVNDENLRPYLNNENLANLIQTFPVRDGQTGSWEILKNNIRKLHEAGVPILAGTDAPNPGTVHGASMHMELQLLTESGLTNEQALAAATSVPATHFKLSDRGRIAAGLRADLLLVDGDPTADIKSTARIAGVWKSGNPIEREGTLETVAAEKENAGAMQAATENRMISDFEADQVTAEFGSGWAVSTDELMGGDSTCEIAISEGGSEDSSKSLEVSGNAREQQPAFSGVMFSPGANPMGSANISSHAGISFWAKGGGETLQVMLFYQKRGFQPSMKTFVAEEDWKQYTFQISDFDGCDGTDVTGIWFGTSSPGEFSFQLDQVQLEK